MKKYYSLIVLISVLLSCSTQNKHEDHAHDDHGNHTTTDEIPTEDHTVWTNKTELFVEFPSLIVGKTSRFATHITRLEKHKAIAEGRVTVSLFDDKKGIRQTVDQPASLGIFLPSLQPTTHGIHTLQFILESAQHSDTMTIDSIMVYSSIDDAKIHADKSEANSISFLKEQAWKMDFETTVVKKKDVYKAIPTFGTWKNNPSQVLSLAATKSGILSFQEENLTIGSYFKKGQTIAQIQNKDLSNNNWEGKINESKLEVDKTKKILDRSQKLHQSKILSQAEFDNIENNYKQALVKLQALQTKEPSSGKTIKAPFDGYVQKLHASNGNFVSEGNPILSFSTQNNNLLEIKVSPQYALDIQNIQDISYQRIGESWSHMKAFDENSKTFEGEVISINNEISKEDPMITIFAKIHEQVNKPIGSFSEVQILVGKPQQNLMIPNSALLENYGKYSVIVQLSGESFEKRDIEIGNKNGDEVEILSGLQENEVVVSTGAYQVKMASMSGEAPAHGHAH